MGNFTNARMLRARAADGAWIEGEAMRQLEAAGVLDGMRASAGMADLHPGRGWPVGGAFVSEALLRPILIGGDVGCGMALWATDLRRGRTRTDKAAARLEGLDLPWDPRRVQEHLSDSGVPSGPFDASMGTIGGGNHFLELQRVAEVFDFEAFAPLGLDPDLLVLLVHTGSRGLGEDFFRSHAARFGAEPLEADSEEGREWSAGHDAACAWAAANRRACAIRALEALGAEGRPILDSPHNFVERRRVPLPEWAGGGILADGLLHRKGAQRAEGTLILPGSRGDLSFLLSGLATEETLFSTAHGAGRKISRGEAKEKLQDRFDKKSLSRTRFGGTVVCGDEDLLWEEAPECYRKAERVAAECEALGSARRIASLEPVVTFKTSSKAANPQEDRRGARGRDGKGKSKWPR